MNSIRLNVLKRNALHPMFQAAMEALKGKVIRALLMEYKITGDECGDWGHYYYCHHDGAKLQFEWDSPTLHLCPVCSKEWRGNTFDGAWTSLAHNQIGENLKILGLIGAIEDETLYGERVVSTLLDYAKYYEQYQIHGDIPYNGPGKLFAQTLDESHWIIDICLAYQLVQHQMSEENKRCIHDGLFRPCSRFLIEHKELQFHNHAVLITSAIAMLGYVLEDPSIQLRGLEGEYGLFDQIERGVLTDGFWYEGAFSYHYYGFYPILQYGLLVEGTEWDIRSHPTIKRMFDFPLRFILPDGKFPSINDTSVQSSIQSYAHFYEIAFDWYGDKQYSELLQLAYGGYDTPSRRISLDALLFGQAPLNKDEEWKEDQSSLMKMMAHSYSSEFGGLTKLVNSKGWHLLVKHSPFGGEHDHMDRLGLSFGCRSEPIMIDPGTTAYGVPAHYAWFKHTYSHNTICINGEDQPPTDGRRLQFQNEDWGTWVESAVDWTEDHYLMKNKIILPSELCPWNEQSYDQVKVRRINALTEHIMLDIVKVTVPEEEQVDLLYHVNGQLIEGQEWHPSSDRLSALSQDLFHDTKCKKSDGYERFVWKVGAGILQQVGWCSQPATFLTARTPSNPLNSFRQTMIHRVQHSKEIIFIHVFSYEDLKDLCLNVEQCTNGKIKLEVSSSELNQHFELDWQQEYAVFKNYESEFV